MGCRMTDRVHSCHDQGHIWMEADGSLYTRHRHRTGTITVSCLYCDQSAELPAYGKETSPFPQEKAKALAVLTRDSPALRDKVAAAKLAFTPAPAKDGP